ncbi:hypothetical protein M422DRAFT_46923 [Sphaerobolus stellatus SS14]|uniref:Glucose receptor Git3 N-terminal domain-containing protein n=1 Tax=Sphaerobolus stellatus (strain SS14) TaxID=990650 RepID=A0A0C9VRR5_SPHS4|nr:hypothetical protein M422DRAFT_46923 [Sphaerobolus stellatus SS14]
MPFIILSLIVIILTLFVGVGFATNRGKIPYFGQTVYWCWIRKEHIRKGIGLEYAWMWFTACMNILFYIPVFLVLQNIVIVKPAKTRMGYKLNFPSKKQRQDLRKMSMGGVKAHRMLFYPAVYIMTVVPIGAARIREFVATDSVPFSATVFCGILFSASGFFNVLVYTFTRPALFRPTPQVAVTAADNKVFFYGAEESRDEGSTSRLPEGNHSMTDEIRPETVPMENIQIPRVVFGDR